MNYTLVDLKTGGQEISWEDKKFCTSIRNSSLNDLRSIIFPWLIQMNLSDSRFLLEFWSLFIQSNVFCLYRSQWSCMTTIYVCSDVTIINGIVLIPLLEVIIRCNAFSFLSVFFGFMICSHLMNHMSVDLKVICWILSALLVECWIGPDS